MEPLSLRIFDLYIFDGINCCPSQIQVVFDDKRNDAFDRESRCHCSAAIRPGSATSAITARASDLVSGMSDSELREMPMPGGGAAQRGASGSGTYGPGCRPRSCLRS